METFQATNNQTNEVRQGTFKDLCDLDKRLWTLVLMDEDETDEPEDNILAWVDIKSKEAPFDIIHYPIYNHSELVGRYL